jgi:hypothetical protein
MICSVIKGMGRQNTWQVLGNTVVVRFIERRLDFANTFEKSVAKQAFRKSFGKKLRFKLLGKDWAKSFALNF